MTKKIALEVSERLIEEYPNPKPALKFNTPYELLVAVILSAQCTDERVNKVTAELFKVADTPEKMVALGAEELEKYIFSCGLYRSKAEHIISASESIVRDYGGKVPENIEDLRKLGGVGRKTANVVASVAFGQDAIAVDTHVFRVSARIGLAKGKTPQNFAEFFFAPFGKARRNLFVGEKHCPAERRIRGLVRLAADGLKSFVQLVENRNTRGYLEFRDLGFVHFVEKFHEPAQAVPVGDDNRVAAVQKRGGD